MRDTAQAHIEALRREEVAGNRYIIARDDSAMRLSSMARQLQECCPEYKLSPRFVPGWQTALYLNWPWVASAPAGRSSNSNEYSAGVRDALSGA